METLKLLFDFIRHIDEHLAVMLTDYGPWIYGILFLIIFVETGLVVMPFLPGDSLLFAAGALCAAPGSSLNIFIMIPLLIVAAVIGDTLNYHVGKLMGPAVFSRDYRFLNKKHLLSTQAFFEKHGGKTIIIARFMPFVRTFAPFVAGIGTMSYSKFISYNVIGAVLWVAGVSIIGYLLGNLPFVQKNFELIIYGIILISVMPPLFEIVRQRMKKDPQ